MAREFESVIRETQYIFEFMDKLPTDVKAESIKKCGV